MEVIATVQPDITVIRIKGKMDIDQGAAFEKDLLAAVASKPVNISMDLGDIEYMDSRGIGILINFQTHINNYGGKLTLYNFKPVFLKVFKMARLDKYFNIIGDDKEE